MQSVQSVLYIKKSASIRFICVIRVPITIVFQFQSVQICAICVVHKKIRVIRVPFMRIAKINLYRFLNILWTLCNSLRPLRLNYNRLFCHKLSL